jgi:hypothetical protein
VLARDLGHDFTLTLATQMSTFVHQFRGDAASTRQFAEETVAISTEKAVAPHMLAAGRIFLGWAATGNRRGEEEGLEEIRKGLARLDATGVQLRRPYYLTLYADACARTGLVAEGLAILAQALRGAERWWEAEAHRLSGELLLAQSAGNRGEAEACFGRALEVARRQSARRWSCAPRRVSRGCGARAGGAPMPGSCSPQSTAGSPRASIPPTSDKRRLCSRSCSERASDGRANTVHLERRGGRKLIMTPEGGGADAEAAPRRHVDQGGRPRADGGGAASDPPRSQPQLHVHGSRGIL